MEAIGADFWLTDNPAAEVVPKSIVPRARRQRRPSALPIRPGQLASLSKLRSMLHLLCRQRRPQT
ncbi:MAG: hypothetical protein KGK16_13705, partial [Bradyrhizobium sp.]|nr:hypothetical protein [Bradyrhizobium sp.]